uniref:Uncharacterized protein n=1 Tax=Rhizophora mucronata TaxID=61149 RepID=A0A2P2PXL2_RHIMU
MEKPWKSTSQINNQLLYRLFNLAEPTIVGLIRCNVQHFKPMI